LASQSGTILVLVGTFETITVWRPKSDFEERLLFGAKAVVHTSTEHLSSSTEKE
jgi:hypothetical protein